MPNKNYSRNAEQKLEVIKYAEKGYYWKTHMGWPI